MKKINQSGQTFVIIMIVLALIIINVLLIATGSVTFLQNTKYDLKKTEATNLAEAGIDKAVASLNSTGGTYSGESETMLGDGSYSVAITNIDAGTKKITATGYIPNKTSPQSKKTVSLTVSKGVGVSFNYGVQVGEGGLDMSNNAQVNGSVYSNGNITMSNNATITGDAFVAGGTVPIPDQQSDCTPPNCTDFIFGTTTGGNQQFDAAQSFIPTTNTVLNKVSLKLRKIGNPPNITVRILRDGGNHPDRNLVIATATLQANLVTTQYGWIDVTFPSPPNLLFNPYWIVLDTNGDSSNYWMWSADSLKGYTPGQGLWSPNWNSTQTWKAANGDLGFKTYMGGVATSIIGTSNSTIGHMSGLTRLGDAHANVLTNLNVIKDVYYSQFLTGVTYGGTAYPNSPDPPLQQMPISDANIADWKAQAAAAGVFNTGYVSSCPHTLAAGQYNGFFSLPTNCQLTVGSPIYVTQGIWMNGNNVVKLDPSLGASSGIFITDGEITLMNNNSVRGSGTAGSYLVMISARDSTQDARNAITANNNGNTGIFYAPKGVVSINNNNTMTELVGWRVLLGNNVIVNYDQGLASSFFTSGPSGSYSVIKGTYQTK